VIDNGSIIRFDIKTLTPIVRPITRFYMRTIDPLSSPWGRTIIPLTSRLRLGADNGHWPNQINTTYL